MQVNRDAFSTFATLAMTETAAATLPRPQPVGEGHIIVLEFHVHSVSPQWICYTETTVKLLKATELKYAAMQSNAK